METNSGREFDYYTYIVLTFDIKYFQCQFNRKWLQNMKNKYSNEAHTHLATATDTTFSSLISGWFLTNWATRSLSVKMNLVVQFVTQMTFEGEPTGENIEEARVLYT